MRVSKLHRWGKKTSVIVTFIEPMPGDRQPAGMSSTAKEFERRVRHAARKPHTFEMVDLVEIPTGTTYADLSAKYAADIERGRQLQKRMFGGSK